MVFRGSWEFESFCDLTRITRLDSSKTQILAAHPALFLLFLVGGNLRLLKGLDEWRSVPWLPQKVIYLLFISPVSGWGSFMARWGPDWHFPCLMPKIVAHLSGNVFLLRIYETLCMGERAFARCQRSFYLFLTGVYSIVEEAHGRLNKKSQWTWGEGHCWVDWGGKQLTRRYPCGIYPTQRIGFRARKLSSRDHAKHFSCWRERITGGVDTLILGWFLKL